MQLRVCPPKNTHSREHSDIHPHWRWVRGRIQPEPSFWFVWVKAYTDRGHQLDGCGLFCTVSAFKSLHILINLHYILGCTEMQITALTANTNKMPRCQKTVFRGLSMYRCQEEETDWQKGYVKRNTHIRLSTPKGLKCWFWNVVML